jgi:hypothetical protein
MRLFEGNVIRVLIEGERWPGKLDSFWAQHGYRIKAPLTFHEPVDLASAKAQPRERL